MVSKIPANPKNVSSNVNVRSFRINMWTIRILTEKPKFHLDLLIMASLYLKAMLVTENLIMSVTVIILSACTKIRYKTVILDCTLIELGVRKFNTVHN